MLVWMQNTGGTWNLAAGHGFITYIGCVLVCCCYWWLGVTAGVGAVRVYSFWWIFSEAVSATTPDMLFILVRKWPVVIWLQKLSRTCQYIWCHLSGACLKLSFNSDCTWGSRVTGKVVYQCAFSWRRVPTPSVSLTIDLVFKVASW